MLHYFEYEHLVTPLYNRNKILLLIMKSTDSISYRLKKGTSSIISTICKILLLSKANYVFNLVKIVHNDYETFMK
jgi:hypothetical protein